MEELKVGIVSLGCAKNLVDTEIMLGIVNREGYAISNQVEKADIIIVNTCGFIGDAKEESINSILEMAEYKEKGSCQVLIATGCLTQRYGKELLQEIPELDGIIGTGDYQHIAQVIEDVLKGKKILSINKRGFLYDHTYPRILSGPPHRAYVKVAEGCSHRCAFCVIPQLRGKYQSREPDSVLAEVKDLSKKGVKEVNFIAQDTTAYGKDLGSARINLSYLLKELSKIEGIYWFRILYGYPREITSQLIEVIAEVNKICNYIDIPLQHSHQDILKKMKRPLDKEESKELVFRLRERIPGIIIRSTFMVGFPGEKDEHFLDLYRFMKEMEFDRAGVFLYSREDGTRAAKMKDQVAEKVKLERFKALMELQQEISLKKNQSFVSKSLEVLVEGKISPGLFYGRFYGQAPEVDGVVYINSSRQLIPGQMIKTRITRSYTYDLEGEEEIEGKIN
ncbi:MAG: 30S ribosomal protein S12 methylthiotransferase RimO [Candidatus Syntrophonatronum acetioxidans]|uniref:Ribosomal protein uS12 methylthiotransferase RimO n=1 Tax=Candidatus Syntrophonatronum acetioxidans TaxID=1795816 RepID=A0A424YE17_9FIRM|nr:MAG: 30S ribosomal protein S12 methylthiotransferase RimO [Candidatus Syntrophonatronum acetioxidans]